MNTKMFEAPVKKKLSHVTPTEADSSPGSSPVRFQRVGPLVSINLDSDSDDCVIVCTEVAPVAKTPAINGRADELMKITNVSSVADSTSSTVIALDNEERSKDESQDKSQSQESVKRKQMESDDEALRPIKRKKLLKKKKVIKKKMKMNEETRDHSDCEDNDNWGHDMYSDDEEMHFSRAIRSCVVDLLNIGTEKDFYGLPSMTQKKIDNIIANRPYVSWADVTFKFGNIKGLPSSMLKSVCNSVVAKDIVKEVLSKCEKVASRIAKRVASVGKLVSEAPAMLNSQMKLSNYQLLGLNWLALMRSEQLNSILADEMGLGKTIQVISFLAYMKEIELAASGIPHLIVVPASTLNNWANEFAKWCSSLKVEIYHGTQDERRYLRHLWFQDGFGDADVILTTYNCSTSSREEKKMFRVKEFNYVIFDEAHMLKNMNTQRYEALIQFNGNYKILLTGTPLQNNLLELMSLLNFLMPSLFKGKDYHIKLLFSKCSNSVNKESSDYERERVEQAKKIIEPFMLRRTKESVLCDLPPKTVSVEKCSLTVDQRAKYEEIVVEFKMVLETKEANCHMSYFMMLRKLANHPLLLRYHFREDMLQEMAVRLAADPTYKGTNVDHIREDLYFKSDFELHCMCEDFKSLENLNYKIADEFFLQSGKFEKLTNMLQSFKADGHRVLIFSQFIQMLDILQELCRIKNYTYLRLDGSTQTCERQEMIDVFNTDNNIFIFLLSTKAGGLGINLTSADTVIIHDIDFNPYNDKQAEDRCHRIGQTKPVQVFRLVSEDTVEEGIQSAADKKLFLEREVTSGCDDDENNIKTVTQLLKKSLGL